MLTWMAIWGGHVLLWFLFAAKLNFGEAGLAAIAAALACLGARVFAGVDRLRVRITPSMLLLVGRIPFDVLHGAWTVLASLAGRLAGNETGRNAVQAMKFDFGGKSPESVGRRVVALAYTTAAPNSIVLGFVPEKDLMLFHRFAAADDLQIARRLGGPR